MALTDSAVRAFKPRDKAYKKSDERGLYLLVTPSGGKLWRFKYRIGPKEKKLVLGSYPEVSLADARDARDKARKRLAQGDDPAAQKQREKVAAKISAANTFGEVAEEFIKNKLEAEEKAPSTVSKARWYLKLLSPGIGNLPIAKVEPQELLVILQRLEAKGKRETAKRCLTFAGRVFRYGVATTRCNSDPAAMLKDALIPPKVKHYAAIIEPKAVGALLRAIDGYDGNPITRCALLIAPHVFVRPGELRHAEWSEFDFEAAEWRIPEGRMKLRRVHAVPLSRQVIGHLENLGRLTGREGYVFPSVRASSRPMSENTLNAAFRRMGYTSDQITAHGLRSTASTLLNESGKWNPDAIERALAHGDSDSTRGAYHRGLYWEERVRMAQWWSDYLDTLKTGAEIIPINRAI